MEGGRVQCFGQVRRVVFGYSGTPGNEDVQRLALFDHVDGRQPALVRHGQIIGDVQLVGRLVVLDHVEQHAGTGVVQSGIGEINTAVLDTFEDFLQRFARTVAEILVLERQ